MKKLLISLLTLVSLNSFAQEEKCVKPEFQAGFDLATTYLWRGFEFGNGPVIQPWAMVDYKNLCLGVWSTTNFVGDSKEVDLFLRYNYKNFTLSLTDLYTIGVPGLNQDYFDFANSTTGHIAELGLAYAGPESFPILLSGGMMVYGLALDPKSDDASKNNLSTYFEIAYPCTIKDYTCNVFAGFVPTESSFYQTEKFSFINVGLKVGKNIQVTENFSVPTNFTLAASPERKTVSFALMCSF